MPEETPKPLALPDFADFVLPEPAKPHDTFCASEKIAGEIPGIEVEAVAYLRPLSEVK